MHLNMSLTLVHMWCEQREALATICALNRPDLISLSLEVMNVLGTACAAVLAEAYAAGGVGAG